ncbi:DEAD/DEAH box helicase [Mycoplasmoides pirum]|uniref:DEAD/DEAH box helicase n=1 Tax=Mycoplasmoides pirum TaxID=2122 RepID=UPI000488D17F|nr:DEAD/DEAH box helicase [Mycoplasmoides pirum]
MNFQIYIQSTLNEMGIKKLTPIQEKVIPLLLKNKNVIAISQTGTGKTLAYLLPILEKINLNINEIQAIIISPTRELATQIKNVLSNFSKYDSRLKTHLLAGGYNSNDTKNKIEKNTGQILVATPHKLLDLLKKGLNLYKFLKYIVYDEADMFIDNSFLNEYIQLRKRLQNYHATEIVLSATLHQDVISKFKKIIDNPNIINVTKSIWVNEKVKHFLVTSKSNNKFDNLEVIINQIKPYLCLIFVNNYKDIEFIQQWFTNHGIQTIALHGKLLPSERKQAFKKINSLKATYVITTDLASRGIDIDGVSHVISWNLPQDDIWYIHRSGRTSRSKYLGESYVMYDFKDEFQLKRLSKKGIIWIPLKINKQNELVRHTIAYKSTQNKNHHNEQYSKLIKKIHNQSKNKKVQPNHKKKVKIKVHKIKQKIKRAVIDKKVKENLIKKYKKVKNLSEQK